MENETNMPSENHDARHEAADVVGREPSENHDARHAGMAEVISTGTDAPAETADAEEAPAEVMPEEMPEEVAPEADED